MVRSSFLALAASFGVVAVQAGFVRFEIDLTYANTSPDGGTSRPTILVNGQSPGPPLILNQGDDVEFVVKNNLADRASAVHFHGIQQIGTPWSDGTPGLSQRPIPSGGSFVYRWTADTYGTYMYHGHSHGEISDGLYGAILIRPSFGEAQPFSSISSSPSDIIAMKQAVLNPNLVLVSDWTGYTFQDWVKAQRASNLELACTNSILVNGKGAIHCPGAAEFQALESPQLKGALNGSSLSDTGCFPPLPVTTGDFPGNPSAVPPGYISGCTATEGSQEVFTVDPRRRWTSMNFISTATIQSPLVSIDQHDMWVYEVDGHYISPVKVQGLQLANGERYSVLVPLTQKPGAYTMRFANANLNQIISGFATMSYAGSYGGASNSTPYFGYAANNLTSTAVVLNKLALHPFPASQPASSASALHLLKMTRIGKPFGWSLSGTQRFRPHRESSTPLLFNPNTTRANNANLIIRTQNATWIDLVFEASSSPATPIQPPHPIHKHSNKAYIIGTGIGPFIWATAEDAAAANPQFFNFATPPLRDTFVTPPAVGANSPTWVVVRYFSENPGAWYLHCHYQTHFSGGMAMAILDGVDAWPDVPAEYRLGA